MGELSNVSVAEMNPCVGRRKNLVNFLKLMNLSFPRKKVFGKCYGQSLMQAPVLLNWTIGFAPETGTRIMTFTITVY